MSNSLLEVVKQWSPPAPDKKEIVEIKGGNYTALYHWFGTADFTQQDKIKSGNLLASFITELVASTPNCQVEDNKFVAISGKKSKETDLLFKILSAPHIIFYREIKGNANLDSEKSPANLEKIANITNALKTSNLDVNSGFLVPPHLNSHDDIEGLNAFLTLIGRDKISELEHKELGLALGAKVRTLL